MEESEKIKEAAVVYARKEKERIATECLCKQNYVKETAPVSVFMAGSPGAGKTESSKNLIKNFTAPIVRIDPDELREYFRHLGYNGTNSSCYQGASTILAERIHDYCIDRCHSFIFDTTFAHITKAESNVARSIKHKRPVQILYVYQEPALAWKFVCAREKEEGRNILPEVFVQDYFKARENVNFIKKKYPEIKIQLIIKNIDNSTLEFKDNVDNIDTYLPERYSIEEVRQLTKNV